MRYILLALAALLPLTAANAQQMRLVANAGTAPDRRTDWIDADSLVRRGGIVRFWIESLFEATDGDGVNRTMIFYRGDCAAMRIGVIQTMRLFADGRPSDTSPGDMNVDVAAPTAETRPLLDRACNTAPYGPPVHDRRRVSEALWGVVRPRQ